MASGAVVHRVRFLILQPLNDYLVSHVQPFALQPIVAAFGNKLVAISAVVAGGVLHYEHRFLVSAGAVFNRAPAVVKDVTINDVTQSPSGRRSGIALR